MTARPCAACRVTRWRRPNPRCVFCREAAALRAAARPLTPLQLYRARLRRLAEIAEQCRFVAIPVALRWRASQPRHAVATAVGVEWLRTWATWGGHLVVGRLLLLSAADETEALLAPTPKGPR